MNDVWLKDMNYEDFKRIKHSQKEYELIHVDKKNIETSMGIVDKSSMETNLGTFGKVKKEKV